LYGLPANLDLSFLVGAELIQVCLGLHQVQFHFHPVGSISVEGGWELLEEGNCIDRRHHGPERPPYQLHRLLGRKVVRSEISPPHEFALVFDSGEMLRVFDDSRAHESFSIQPIDVFV
jgi:hypothetical protein